MILPDGYRPLDVPRGPDRDLRPEEIERLFDSWLKHYPRTVRADGRTRAKAVWHKYVTTRWQFQALERELMIWLKHWSALGWPRAAIPKPHAWLEMRTWLE
jgi:hypothetical protein